jgi:hypothetical protein
VSLILDALRKLERDRGQPEPSVVVVGHVPWRDTFESRRPLVLAGSLLAVALVVATAVWLARRTAPEKASAGSSLTAERPALPTPAPVTSAAAAPTQAARPLAADAERAPAAHRLDLPEGSSSPAASRAPEAPVPDAEPASRPSAGDRLQLMAISERDGQPVAIISDHLVHVGDSFDGVTVLRIGTTEVEVEDRGRRRVLKF